MEYCLRRLVRYEHLLNDKALDRTMIISRFVGGDSIFKAWVSNLGHPQNKSVESELKVMVALVSSSAEWRVQWYTTRMLKHTKDNA
jgi:hypothetical protein